ncbi:MAG TPA: 3-phosphoglycerate dehydrogenase [Flavobacteriales bacterium]|nr:3-phosphoglycerate dehydrogenase [Flavobacteriales bacterium]|tara:strand:+ start:548 stop:1513 length:966 start_codon:yes stop_codon:yes gene_type:complete
MNILANDGISSAGLAELEKEGHRVWTDFVAAEQLIDFINSEHVDGLLVRSATKVREPLIDACPNLKFIIRGGVGMDNIDVAYARSNGVQVNNTPAASSQSVAELVMGHLFTLSRFLHDSNRRMPVEGGEQFKTLKKAYGKGRELRGTTLAIVGFGRIGQSLAQYALGCGMKVIGVDQFIGKYELAFDIAGQQVNVDIPIVTLDEALEAADALSLHIPAPANGQAVIDAATIAKMKPGALLLNAARGGVVDEDAMLEALDSGQLGGAGIDVFVGEPKPRLDVIRHQRISLTPHVGAATSAAQERIGLEIAKIVKEICAKQSA